MFQTVKDYAATCPFLESTLQPEGGSAAPKGMIFHIVGDNAAPIQVMDIGFGTGTLGQMIKDNPTSRHWVVDGLDGFEPNCKNRDLIEKKIYRNIWHGLAQDFAPEQWGDYQIICLFDVIEHLDIVAAKSLLRTLLETMGQQALLLVSTPLWFYPQDSQQSGDLEEHQIGVPVTSMMALIPTMYAIMHPLVGGFALNKNSLDYIEFFQPTTDRNFTIEKGLAIIKAVGMQYIPGTLFRVG
jgi:2-polyprenyl-3-methyl-5-hydroxy-6-metoxy-1,4-benzoquinol methylase